MTKKYNRIFAALDGGKTQDMVVDRAIELAEGANASLMFGHVVDSAPTKRQAPISPPSRPT